MLMIIVEIPIVAFNIAEVLLLLFEFELEDSVHEVPVFPASEVFPGSHAVHVPADADGLWKPAWHLLHDVSDAHVWQPVPQAVQEVTSLLSTLKVPAGQAVQVPSEIDGVWKLTLHLEQEVADEQVLQPAPQFVHEFAVFMTAVKVLSPQAVQVPSEIDGLWKPALHLEQEVVDEQVWQPAPQFVHEFAELRSSV